MTTYDFSKAKEAGDAVGLVWREDMVPWIDASFASLGLTQDQVDGVMKLYVAALAQFEAEAKAAMAESR
jgi:hypothetical protein